MTGASVEPAHEGDRSALDLAARPYGLVGLVLSTVAILLVATLACALIGAAAFGIAVAIVGLDGALAILARLDPSGAANKDFLVRMNIVVGLVLYLVLATTILGAARVRGGLGWRRIVGWRPWHPFRGSALFWVLLALTLAYSVGADRLISHAYPEAHDWTPHPSGLGWDVLFVVLAALFAPITEELLFRGWLYTSLRLSIGIPLAILVTATLFALAHWERTHLYAAAIFPIGLVLGVLRERTGSIGATICFHALYNGFASALLFSN